MNMKYSVLYIRCHHTEIFEVDKLVLHTRGGTDNFICKILVSWLPYVKLHFLILPEIIRTLN